MLKIRDLSISFRRYNGLLRQQLIPRLSNIRLDVAPGEVVALIGPSGAGKSLIAHAIMGLLPKNCVMKGEIYHNGVVLDRHIIEEKRGREISLLPQQISCLDPTARVGKQISWAAERAGTKVNADEQLRNVGLPPQVGSLYPHQLSGGMAKRILVAQANAAGAPLLIADEPTTGLDPSTRDLVLDRIRKHADQGGAVLLITHDLMPALTRADRIALIRDGQMSCTLPTSAFNGSGDGLTSDYARSLWRALPQNGFEVYA